ncbi:MULTISPECIES: hypothetical protein [Lacticaseibacillus]|uniref:hypothetical protein n=1 Tax=Lacticaseibacillus TaxID=2759736 RepID=UPI000F794E7B|nr:MULTISPECIES: hypothetical protein [Lacticaseibacillus]
MKSYIIYCGYQILGEQADWSEHVSARNELEALKAGKQSILAQSVRRPDEYGVNVAQADNPEHVIIGMDYIG